MMRLELFGGFSVLLGRGLPCVLPTRKAQALLAYLALPLGRPHARDKLTALLWGDMPEAQARQNFRQTLTRLRRTLGDAVLVTHHDTVALEPTKVTVDVVELEDALRSGEVPALERASTLYKGDFLEGLRVDEAPFEEWYIFQRERLHELALEGLARLLREHMRAEQIEAATRTASKILALDPLQEGVHRILMRLLSRQGRRAAALQQYQVCVGWLERELGVEPDEETRTLYRELLRGNPATRESARPIGPASLLAPDDRRAQQATSNPMVGRRAEAVARGLGVLGAWCHETEQPLPFRPWIDALRGSGPSLETIVRDRLTVTLQTSLVRVFPELASAGELPATTSDQHAFLFEALNALIHRLAEEKPLVIVLEDLHWADAMSTRLLAFLGRRLGSLPVLIVASARTEDMAETPVLERALDELRTAGTLHEVAVGALSLTDTVALARALHAPGKRPGSFEAIADDLWALSAGNPFVIVETMRAFTQGAGAPPALPQGVRRFVSARLARLSEAARRILSTAAVVGRACSFKLLAQSAGVNEMDGAAAIEELIRRRVLDMAGDHLVICHDRIRQVAYDELGSARRLVLHGAVGQALETLHADDLDEIANELGHHALRAGHVERALVYLERFADVATRRYALDAAIDARRQALEAAKALPASVRDRRQLEIGVRMGFVFSLSGRHRDAHELLRSHVPLLQRVGDPTLASEHYFRLAVACQFFGQHAEGRAAAVAAIQEAERAGDGERAGKGFYAVALMDIGSGAISSALEHAKRAEKLLDTPAMVHWRGLNYWILTWAYALRGALAEAFDSAERCAAIAGDTGDRRLHCFAAYITALAHVTAGDSDAALECAQRAMHASSDPVSRGVAHLALGSAHLERGEARAAIDVLHELLRGLVAVITRGRALALLAEAHRILGDTAACTNAAREALAEAEAYAMPLVSGLAQRTMGRIARGSGDLARGEAYLSEALESFRAGEADLEVAMTRLDLARALSDRGERGGAREHLDEAMKVFTTAGAPRRAAQTAQITRDLGIEASA